MHLAEDLAIGGKKYPGKVFSFANEENGFI